MAQKISLARDSLQAHEPAHRLSRIRRQGYQRWRLLRSYFSLAWLYEKRWFFIARGLCLHEHANPAGAFA